MALSKESIQEFKKIFKKKFGEDITDQEAMEHGTKLVEFVKLIYNIKAKEDYKKLNK